MRTTRKLAGTGFLAVALTLSACGGDDGDTTAATAIVSSSDSTTTTATSDDATTTTEAAAATPTTVDANNASIDELATAFEAVGVANAERWAREVDEYRPYSGADDWAKLKQELSKYNIDDATLAKILSVLEV
jgi:DNA uptake protein ComE-like DNA-binding protein